MSNLAEEMQDSNEERKRGNEFTAASRERKFKKGNIQVSTKHYWV